MDVGALGEFIGLNDFFERFTAASKRKVQMEQPLLALFGHQAHFGHFRLQALQLVFLVEFQPLQRPLLDGFAGRQKPLFLIGFHLIFNVLVFSKQAAMLVHQGADASGGFGFAHWMFPCNDPANGRDAFRF